MCSPDITEYCIIRELSLYTYTSLEKQLHEKNRIISNKRKAAVLTDGTPSVKSL